jgi:hypothetical protein
MSQLQRLCLLALCLLSPMNPVSAGQTCLKLVFDRYCLGGDYDTLMHNMPPPLLQTHDEEGQGAIFLEERERIYVLAFKGRIYKVELSHLVSSKYGPPQDLSRFPPYVDSRASRIVAIRRGDGRALQVWPGGQGIRIELSWTREMGVALSYIVEQLDAQRRKEMLGGL